MITDQYYEYNCYHVTMANEGKDLMISCQHFVDLHVLEASATQITHVRLIRPTGFCSIYSTHNRSNGSTTSADIGHGCRVVCH